MLALCLCITSIICVASLPPSQIDCSVIRRGTPTVVSRTNTVSTHPHSPPVSSLIARWLLFAVSPCELVGLNGSMASRDLIAGSCRLSSVGKLLEFTCPESSFDACLIEQACSTSRATSTRFSTGRSSTKSRLSTRSVFGFLAFAPPPLRRTVWLSRVSSLSFLRCCPVDGRRGVRASLPPLKQTAPEFLLLALGPLFTQRDTACVVLALLAPRWCSCLALHPHCCCLFACCVQDSHADSLVSLLLPV